MSLQPLIDLCGALVYVARMKPVIYSKLAQRSLERMQPKRQAAIKAKVHAFARGETVDVKKLVGTDLVRIRVGNDRVIIDEQTGLVLVINVGPRGGIYKE
jgi:mRNA interferase RelE/StbE